MARYDAPDGTLEFADTRDHPLDTVHLILWVDALRNDRRRVRATPAQRPERVQIRQPRLVEVTTSKSDWLEETSHILGLKAVIVVDDLQVFP